jgi:hypothetical protein
VPLTAGGNLSIVTSSDLGGLGAKNGTPVAYKWELPGMGPQLLPWLAILGLLVLKTNRTASAWLIWLPVGCVLALTLLPLSLPAGSDILPDVFGALAFGMAATWLLSGYLRKSHRLITFFCILFTLAGFSLLAFVARESADLLEFQLVPFAIVLGVGVFISAVALSLGGWLCRRSYHPFALGVWLFVSLFIVWLAVTGPFFIVALISSGGAIPWSEFFVPVLGMAAANFVLLLPFLILSSANSLFRERLKFLLHVPSPAPPTLNLPAMPATA